MGITGRDIIWMVIGMAALLGYQKFRAQRSGR